MGNLHDRFDESDQAAFEWLQLHSEPGQLTRLAVALKRILDDSGYGDITLLVRDGKIQGYPKMTVAINDKLISQNINLAL